MVITAYGDVGRSRQFGFDFNAEGDLRGFGVRDFDLAFHIQNRPAASRGDPSDSLTIFFTIFRTVPRLARKLRATKLVARRLLLHDPWTRPTGLADLIAELEAMHRRHGDIEVWVKWTDPEKPTRMCYGERLTEVRLEPVPPGRPVCVIHAQPA